MSSRRYTAVAAACTVLFLAVLRACGDVWAHRSAMNLVDALQTLLLWLLLAAPFSVATGLVFFTFAERMRALGPLVSARSVTRGAGLGVLLLSILTLLLPLWHASVPSQRAGVIANESSASDPNIVLIVLDTQRADHLGFMGDKRGLTPNLDRLAAQSTVYTRCFAAASWTVPSHATLFTGLYPPTHGASFEHHRWLDARFITLAEALSARGYDTAAFVANEWVQLSNELQGFARTELLGDAYKSLALRPFLEILGFPARFMDHGATDAISRVGRYLDEAPNAGKPRFVFINLLEPHWRYLPPLAARLNALPPGMSVLSATRRSQEFYGPLALASKSVDPRTRQAISALYAGAVRYQDERLGELLALLDARLRPDNTLLIVTSDHGENLGEGGRYDHVFAVNDALVHVPMLFRYPRLFPPGERQGALCSQIDLSRTVMDIVPGAALAPSSDARSLLPDRLRPRASVFIAGDPYLGHFGLMASRTGFVRDVAQFNATLRAVRDEHFKYVDSSRTGGALYDLDDDPDEVKDVLAEQPVVGAALRAQLASYLAREPRYVAHPTTAVPAAEAELLERLKSLGYVQ